MKLIFEAVAESDSRGGYAGVIKLDNTAIWMTDIRFDDATAAEEVAALNLIKKMHNLLK